MFRLLRTLFALLLGASISIASLAAEEKTAASQNEKSGELFDTIAKMDAAIFGAFNAHDAARLMSLFTDDLEFYHDTGGLTNYQQSADSFKKMFAGTPDIRRNLVPGSLKVYPVKDHGAIELGLHRFCHKENGKDECGTFEFAMVWRKLGDSWKISRVLSYGHTPAK